MMSFFEKALQFVGFQQVVKRIIERPHVGIDLLLQRPGQKTEALARFHCRAREDDAVDLLREQGRDGHGHGQIGFSRAAGANGKNHVVSFQRFEIALLVRALRRDAFLAERMRARGREGAAKFAGRFGGGDLQQRFHFLAVGQAAFADALVVFAENPGGALDLCGSALNFQIVVAQMGRNVQG